MIFINVDERKARASRQTQYLLAVLGITLTLVLFTATSNQHSPIPKMAIEEVESVHVLLDQIQNETPELATFVDAFRIRFSQNPAVLPSDFLIQDMDTRKIELLKALVSNSPPVRTDEIAIVGE